MSRDLPTTLDGVRLPSGLGDLERPPERLYLTGTLPSGTAIAVVGTREPTAEALQFTATLVGDLVKAGVVVLSGGAKGIDAAAHRAAMDAGGLTVVVAPSGWNRPYPVEHAELFHEIVDRGGGHLSIAEPDRTAANHQFFARNGVMVALSRAVVVVQAGYRSGARNAAKHARRIGRPVFAVPSCPWVSRGQGCNLEIALGAHLLLDARDLLSELSSPTVGSCSASAVVARCGSPSRPKPRDRKLSAGRGIDERRLEMGLPSELAQVLAEVRGGTDSVDVLVEHLGLGTPELQRRILHLTLAGLLAVDRAGKIYPVTG